VCLSGWLEAQRLPKAALPIHLVVARQWRINGKVNTHHTRSSSTHLEPRCSSMEHRSSIIMISTQRKRQKNMTGRRRGDVRAGAEIRNLVSVRSTTYVSPSAAWDLLFAWYHVLCPCGALMTMARQSCQSISIIQVFRTGAMASSMSGDLGRSPGLQWPKRLATSATWVRSLASQLQLSASSQVVIARVARAARVASHRACIPDAASMRR